MRGQARQDYIIGVLEFFTLGPLVFLGLALCLCSGVVLEQIDTPWPLQHNDDCLISFSPS